MNDKSIITLHSDAWPNAFLRIDGTKTTKATPSGGPDVNCQYYDFSGNSKFKPTDILAYERLIVHKTSEGYFSFESHAFRKRYLRLVGSQGAKVNLQYHSSPPDFKGCFELFKFVSGKENGTFHLESVQFPGYYIQINGAGVNAFNAYGNGSVLSSNSSTADGAVLRGLILGSMKESVEESVSQL